MRRIHKSLARRFIEQIELQTMIFPGVILLLLFAYLPMYGVIMAFKNYTIISKSILSAPWVGLKFFEQALGDAYFLRSLRNSVGINILSLIIRFPAPIIFAILLNEIKSEKFKRITQTVSYLPHFISWVIFSGIVMNILSTENGILNDVLISLGLIEKPLFFMGDPKYFWWVAVLTLLAKDLGWGAIIYLSAIAGIDQEMFEAAHMDGVNRFQKIWYITLPSIMGTMVIIFILTISNLLNWGFDQIFMLQNNVNISMAETLETYVYKIGLKQMRFPYATAVGLMKSVIAVILLVSADKFSKKTTGKGIY